jgi:hypothetical protein
MRSYCCSKADVIEASMLLLLLLLLLMMMMVTMRLLQLFLF